MTAAFNRWTVLDPALALKAIEADQGKAIFTQWDYLDPDRAMRDVSASLGKSVFNQWARLDPVLALAQDQQASSGAAPAVAWTPANLPNLAAWYDGQKASSIIRRRAAPFRNRNGKGNDSRLSRGRGRPSDRNAVQ